MLGSGQMLLLASLGATKHGILLSNHLVAPQQKATPKSRCSTRFCLLLLKGVQRHSLSYCSLVCGRNFFFLYFFGCYVACLARDCRVKLRYRCSVKAQLLGVLLLPPRQSFLCFQALRLPVRPPSCPPHSCVSQTHSDKILNKNP